MRCLLTFALSLLGPLASAREWRLQYFFDEDKSSLAILDLKFPSSKRGVAVGVIAENKGGRQRPVALVTSDGGVRWDIVPLRETAHSLFFLNETIGWMATDRGIWQTLEAGRTWTKLKGMEGIRSLWFINERQGWAAGFPKAVHQTSDGGRTWQKLAAAAEPKSNPSYTVYSSIAFAGAFGIIAGSSRPPRRMERDALPEWVDPQSAALRRERPTLSILLETRDAGNTWKSSTASIFGRIAKVALWQDAQSTSRIGTHGLALLEFTNNFQVPSEIVHIDLRSGKSDTVYRHKERVLTDLELVGIDGAFVAGQEPPGSFGKLPIPGRVIILESKGFKEWREMEVDYRATACRVILARSPDGGLWAATDTGMVLRLEETPPPAKPD
jgi:hypothetical protein